MRYFRQKTDYACGPASLRMVLSAFGINKSEEFLAKAMKATRKTGVEHHSFGKICEKLRLECVFSKNAAFSQLNNVLKSGFAIVCYNHPKEGGHYAVVHRVGKSRIYLYDPWFGRDYSIEKRKFRKMWVDSRGVRGVLISVCRNR